MLMDLIDDAQTVQILPQTYEQRSEILRARLTYSQTLNPAGKNCMTFARFASGYDGIEKTLWDDDGNFNLINKDFYLYSAQRSLPILNSKIKETYATLADFCGLARVTTKGLLLDHVFCIDPLDLSLAFHRPYSNQKSEVTNTYTLINNYIKNCGGKGWGGVVYLIDKNRFGA